MHLPHAINNDTLRHLHENYRERFRHFSSYDSVRQTITRLLTPRKEQKTKFESNNNDRKENVIKQRKLTGNRANRRLTHFSHHQIALFVVFSFGVFIKIACSASPGFDFRHSCNGSSPSSSRNTPKTEENAWFGDDSIGSEETHRVAGQDFSLASAEFYADSYKRRIISESRGISDQNVEKLWRSVSQRWSAR